MSGELLNLIVRAGFMIIFAMVSWLVTKYLKPWLEQNNLITAAKIAVQAAEAMYGRYHGEEKLKSALSQLAAKGWDIEAESVIAAVKSAWLELNMDQLMTGEKQLGE